MEDILFRLMFCYTSGHMWLHIPDKCFAKDEKYVSGKVCFGCGKVKLQKRQPVIFSEEEMALKIYSKYWKRRHRPGIPVPWATPSPKIPEDN